MKTELELAHDCISLLAAEGIDAHIERAQGDNFRLRVPKWEAEDGDLKWRSVFEFIHHKLGGNPRHGLVAKTPATDFIEIYTYDPLTAESGHPVTITDLMHWGYGKSVDEFDWEDAVWPDDANWEDGYDAHVSLRHISQRVGFVSTLLNSEIVELPLVKPITPQELLEALSDGTFPDGIRCDTKDRAERLVIRLNAERQLVVCKRSDRSETVMGDDHFDHHGRVVFEGEVLLHRTWW